MRGRRRPRRAVSRLLAGALSGSVAMGCGSEPRGPAASVAPTFVGAEACAGCHEEEAARWRGSHHDLAMQAATPETVLGDFDGVRFRAPGSEWTFSRRGDAYLVGVDGADEVPGEYRVAYTFGVFPLQQYLVEFPGGRYQVVPIVWDSRPAGAGGQRWYDVQGDERIPPGDPLHWTGPNLNWNAGCAECHSTALRKNYSTATETYATEWVDLDVACEACHGPGSEHVERATALEGDATGADATRAGAATALSGLLVRLEPHDPAAWEPDPATGTARPQAGADPDDQFDVCGRCHARRSPLTAGYEHGASLLDAYRPALIDEGLYFADGQIRDEVYVWGSFVQSAMYRGGVTCNDCHEPHGLRLRAEGNDVCTVCHVASVFDVPDHHGHPDGSSGARCVSCHMPERTYMGVDPRRDHSLRVPEPLVSDAVGSPDPCTTCHDGMTPAEAAASIAARRDGPATRRTEHHAEAIEAARRGDPGSRAGLRVVARDPRAPAITRATALSLLGSDRDPEDLASLDAGMADPDPVVRMGALRAVRDAPSIEIVSRAAALLEDPVRAVRLAAVEATAPFLTGAAAPGEVPEGLRSSLAAGMAEYREAQEAQADRPEAWMNLAWLAGLQGAPGEVEAALERAVGLDSTFAPAYVNLSDLYRRTGRDAEGEPLLRAGLDRSPGSAELHHALGLLLVRAGQDGEARTHLRRAAELETRRTRYAYVWAVALQTDGDTAAARAVLEEALARSPRDRDVLLALAVLHRDAGRHDEALRYARALAEAHPSDPSAEALLRELSR